MSTQTIYAVTGATGELGRRVVAALAARVPPASIVAIVRDPARATDLLPAGVVIRQGDYEDAASLDAALEGVDRLLLICGHYEGVDERIREHLADEEISIGNYVLTNGALPAMVTIDAVVRLIPGVVGNADSTEEESFAGGENGEDIVEWPQYTRPVEFRGSRVPEVLLGGNHAEIRAWRKTQAALRTRRNRADLLRQNPPSDS